MELIRKSDALHAVLHNQGDAAVAAVQMIPSAWISVEDRLPYNDQMVLIPITEKDIPCTEILICRYIKCERPIFRHYGFRGIKDFIGVTHWMPLPDAPEVDE